MAYEFERRAVADNTDLKVARAVLTSFCNSDQLHFTVTLFLCYINT